MPHLSAQERRRHFHGELLTVRAMTISCTSYHMEILAKAFWRSICAAHIMRIRISLQYIRGRLGIAWCSLHNYICSPIFGLAGLCTCSTNLHVVTIQNIITSLLVCCISPGFLDVIERLTGIHRGCLTPAPSFQVNAWQHQEAKPAFLHDYMG